MIMCDNFLDYNNHCFHSLTKLTCLLYEVYKWDAINSVVASFCGCSNELRRSTILMSSSQRTGPSSTWISAFLGMVLRRTWPPCTEKQSEQKLDSVWILSVSAMVSRRTNKCHYLRASALSLFVKQVKAGGKRLISTGCGVKCQELECDRETNEKHS